MLVDPGDYLYSPRTRADTAMVALVRDGLDALRYDALGLGQKEIDRLSVNPGALDALPIVSSNVRVERDGRMARIGSSYVIREYGPMRVGVFGLTEPDSAALPFGVDIGDPEQATREVLEEFDRWKVDVVVLLSMLERGRALALVKAFPAIHVVVFGHATTSSYPDGDKLRGLPALSLVTGGLGLNLARGRIVLSGGHDILERTAALLQVDPTIQPEPAMAQRMRRVDEERARLGLD